MFDCRCYCCHNVTFTVQPAFTCKVPNMLHWHASYMFCISSYFSSFLVSSFHRPDSCVNNKVMFYILQLILLLLVKYIVACCHGHGTLPPELSHVVENTINIQICTDDLSVFFLFLMFSFLCAVTALYTLNLCLLRLWFYYVVSYCCRLL